MSRRTKRTGTPVHSAGGAATSPSATGSLPDKDSSGKLRGWRLWRFRLLAVFGVPLVLLALVEVGLRVAGYGYPTHFFLKYSQGDKSLYVQNNQFGWRFFGPAMAREPDAFAFPRTKAPGTIRIFVFGESAAFGDPQSAFGLPRMLEALLELRHPGVKFEVINAAMTAINSNVILPIARDCARADGDVWVVYMGNNEVVGPFGAGTVFGPQSPPIPLIRTSLALKATRLGQLVDDLHRRLSPPASTKSEWGGMEMFLDQQVRADDPRMTATYANFQQNLADIIKAGRKSGAGVVVSTVAVNLRDCSPFGSSHRSGLSSDQLEKWNSYYQQGIEAQKAKAWQAADTLLRDAAAIDDTYAELRFRLGMCAIVMTNQAEAQQDFAAARDLDTLRFRCDSKLNDTIRRTVTEAQDPAVLLADAEQTFAQRTPGGIPGDDLFYEHVHLTFIGNYVLAEAIAPQIEKLLPASVAKAVPPDMTWELGAACIQRLAWDDWSFESAITSILERFRDPPFTQQLSHDTEGTYWQNLLKDLVTQYLKRGETDPVKESLKTCEAAIAAWPDDPALYEQLTALKLTGGDFPGAAEAGQRAVALRPSSSDDWSELGLALGQSGRLADAASAFQQAFALDPEDVWSRYNLAQAYEKMNRRDDAIAEYRRAVALKPRFGPAWLALGKDLAASGDKAAAESCFHLAVTNRVHQPAELNTLAQFCVSNGWFQDAVMIYDEAAQLSPGDKLLPFQSAMILKNLADVAQRNGHADAAANLGQQAAVRFGIAAQVDPDFMQAHYYYASLVADPKVSVHEFQEVVRLEPKMFQGHLNLGLALERIGSNDQAVVQYQETLKLDPSNNQAAARLQALLAKPVQ